MLVIRMIVTVLISTVFVNFSLELKVFLFLLSTGNLKWNREYEIYHMNMKYIENMKHIIVVIGTIHWYFRLSSIHQVMGVALPVSLLKWDMRRGDMCHSAVGDFKTKQLPFPSYSQDGSSVSHEKAHQFVSEWEQLGTGPTELKFAYNMS